MNILLVSHDLTVTGAPNSLLRQARYFRDAGHNVDIWALDGGGLKNEYINNGFFPVIVGNSVKEIKEMWKNRKHNYDFIICNTVVTYKAVDFLQRQKIPLVWFVRETKLVDDKMRNNTEFAQVFKNFYNIYTVSKYAANIVRQYNSNVRVINNAVFDNFKKIKKTGKKIIFGYIGSVIPVKGVDLLLSAFTKLLKNNKNIELYVAGYAPMEMQKQYHNQKIKYLGEVQGTDKEKFFENIDVLVVPSLDEPSGLTVIEGAMYGKPVITTDKTGANYIVKNGKNGFVAKAGDVDELYKYMKEILTCDLDIMKRASRDMYLKYGTIERERNEVIQMLYDNLGNLPIVKNKPLNKKILKIFSKERCANGRRHIYFCGIKVASYQRKKHVSSNNQQIIKEIKQSSDKTIIDAILESVLLSDGFDNWQLDFLWHYFMARSTKNTENNKNLWLSMITMLILTKRDAHALSLLNSFVSRFGIDAICNYGPVSGLAKECIKTTQEIDVAANFYKQICSLRKKQHFENLIKKAKTIAIVGRSPCICGKNKGEEIDSHDIVIRFNNSDISGKYQKDYGKKIDINFINMWLDNKDNVGSLCVYKDYRIFNTNPDIVSKIKADLKNNIDILDFGLKHWVCNFSGLDEPTSGAIAILWVYKILGSLDNVDIYGFAFQDEKHSLSHFDADHVINTDNHNMIAEMAFLTNFIKQQKLKGKTNEK